MELNNKQYLYSICHVGGREQLNWHGKTLGGKIVLFGFSFVLNACALLTLTIQLKAEVSPFISMLCVGTWGVAMAKIFFVTPYYKEDFKLIKRCLESVKNQSISCDHILIADGFPQKWIDDTGVRHLILDRSHGDAGNTPRGLGALLAIAEEYDGIGFLDADNWLERNMRSVWTQRTKWKEA